MDKPKWQFESLEYEVLQPTPLATEREYRHTLKTVAGLQITLDSYRTEAASHPNPGMRQLSMDALQSLIDEWGQQARDYEALKNGSAPLSLSSLRDLPHLLMRARVASKMTQKQLAAKLGLNPRQIQRYEATRYRTITLERMLEVAEALGLKLSAPVSLGR